MVTVRQLIQRHEHVIKFFRVHKVRDLLIIAAIEGFSL